MNNPAFLKELQDIAKIQKKCIDKHCKKEADDVQNKINAISKKVQTGMISVQTGKMNQKDYMNMIQKEIKKGFKEIYSFMHSKEVYASTACTIKMCNVEFRKTLLAIAHFLEILCKQSATGPFKFVCEAEKEIKKLEKQETITAEAYIKILLTMAQKTENIMVR